MTPLDPKGVRERAVEEVRRLVRLTLPDRHPGVKALDIIVRSLDTPLAFEDVCESWGVNPSSVRSRFARAKVPSLVELCRHVRCYYVLALVRGGHSLEVAAEQLEFSSRPAMVRGIKQLYGLAGNTWAKRTRLNEQLDVLRSILKEYAQAPVEIWNLTTLTQDSE